MENASVPDIVEDALEPWPDWIKRTTHEAEERLDKLSLRDWVDSHKQAVVRWLDKLREGTNTWAQRIFLWHPSHMTRRAARPRRRWADAAADYALERLHHAELDHLGLRARRAAH